MSDLQKTYRVYSYDGVRQIVSADWISAASDEEAISTAKTAGFATRCEVWDGKRLVAQLGLEAA